MTNLIPEVCKLLGVEVGEEFKISDERNMLYKFDNKGLNFFDNDSSKWYSASNSFFH